MRTSSLEAIFNQVKEQELQEMKNYYLNQTFRLAADYLEAVVIDQCYEKK